MAIEIVLFDAVGTLIEPSPPVAQAYAGAGKRHGCSLDEREIASRFSQALSATDWSGPTNGDVERHRWRTIVAEVFRETGAALDGLFDQLWRHFGESRNWRVYPDVAVSWQHLESIGVQIGVASNFDARLLDVVRGLESLDRARHVVCSSQIGFSKPSLEFFRTVERRLGFESDAILMVGDDRKNDYEAAIAAGWRAVHLDRRGGAGGSSIESLDELVHCEPLVLGLGGSG